MLTSVLFQFAMMRFGVLVTGAVASREVYVPGGKFIQQSCLHEVPTGTSIDENDHEFIFTFPNETVVKVPLCEPNGTKLGVSHGNAWKAWAQFKLSGSSAVTGLSNSWIVPEDPTVKSNQILYYWNGVEDGSSAGGSGVLQPVLEWRSSSGWGIKSWYVGAGGTVTSGLVPVKPGDKILGSMKNSNGAWTVTGQAEGGSPATLNYNRQSLTFTYAYEVLEAYTVGSSCAMYPPQSSGVTFTETAVEFDGKDATDSIEWDAYSCPSGPGCTGSSGCSEVATVHGNDVTISYRTTSLV